MKKLSVILLFLALFLTACEGVWVIGIERIQPETTSSPIQTTPSVTLTITSTATPTATLDPTPTREILNQIQTTARASLRSEPRISADTFIRVTDIGETFVVQEICNDWLNVGVGYLFNGNWIAGDLSAVPECTQATVTPIPPVNDFSRVGYNTLEVYNETYYINHLLSICPAYMLVMDNIALADRVYQALNNPCGTQVIHRDWHPSDGEEHLVRTPEQFVAKWVQQGYPHLIRYTTNEVSCYDNCETYVAHEVEIARLARQVGYTVVLGNTGVGKYSPQSVLQGVFNPLVQAANTYDHLLGFHEYTGVCLCFGFGQMATEWLADNARVQPDRWSNNVSFSLIPFTAQTLNTENLFGAMMLQAELQGYITSQALSDCIGDLPSYWHMGRSFWILLIYECSTGNVNNVDIVHTEWGWDRLDDISSVVNPLEAEYGLLEFNYDFRGWQSYSRLWTERYWRNWSVAEAAYNQIVHTTALYPDNHYFLLFAWTDNCNRDWYRAGFGFGNCSTDGDAQELHRMFEVRPPA